MDQHHMYTVHWNVRQFMAEGKAINLIPNILLYSFFLNETHDYPVRRDHAKIRPHLHTLANPDNRLGATSIQIFDYEGQF